MFFPIRTDRRLIHTPWVNYALIAINLLVFMAGLKQQAQSGHFGGSPVGPNPAEPYYLNPRDAHLFQFITYQFLHADGWHVLGNMVFLYAFGNSVEDRLGKIGYLAFYLSGGVLAGLGHCMFSDARVLGASGSVAAVTGAYLALFPLSNVTIVYWFILIGSFEISSLYLIGFFIAQNVVFQLISSGGVAYMAHLAGYAYGFAIGMGLLWARLLPREPFDLLAMLDRYRRRRQFAALTSSGYHPWEAASASATPGQADAPTKPISAEESRVMDRRAKVAAALSQHDLRAAAEAYARLLDLDAGQVMGQQVQLDLANEFMVEGKHKLAAQAYELFLNAFRQYPDREQIQLILAVIYVRYLDRRQRAVELLTAALPRLHDQGQRELAEQTLAQVQR
jgi:membrane associated rhomboid family serine protease